MTTSNDEPKHASKFLDFWVTRIGVFNPVDGRLIFERPIETGDLRLSGLIRGEQSSDGRIGGQFAGLQIGPARSQSPLTCRASIQGFNAKRIGRPSTRTRDIALSLAVGYHQLIAESNGESVALDTVYETLAKDAEWGFFSQDPDADHESLKKACLRGDKIIKSECFGVAAIWLEFVAGEADIFAFALVKKNGTFQSFVDGAASYEGYPWAWAPGLYEILSWERFQPLKIPCTRFSDLAPTTNAQSQG